MNNKWTGVLLFLAGVSVGMNWPKIRKFALPYFKDIEKGGAVGYAALVRFMMEQKEKLEDMLAEAKITRTKADLKKPKITATKADLETPRKAPRQPRKKTASRGTPSPVSPLRAPRRQVPSRPVKGSPRSTRRGTRLSPDPTAAAA